MLQICVGQGGGIRKCWAIIIIIPYFEILVKSFSSKYTIITSSVPHNYVRYMIESFTVPGHLQLNNRLHQGPT